MIIADLQAGLNVVGIFMSTKALYRLQTRILEKGILLEADIVVHTALSSSENMALLDDVETKWKVRLLMYSPTVEAAVNFAVRWFDSKYIFMCTHSATARGVWQGSLRVRHTSNPVVNCCIQSGISVLVDDRVVVPVTELEIFKTISNTQVSRTNDTPSIVIKTSLHVSMSVDESLEVANLSNLTSFIDHCRPRRSRCFLKRLELKEWRLSLSRYVYLAHDRSNDVKS
jgi:hypothetical protein